jgi:hypothetical protein
VTDDQILPRPGTTRPGETYTVEEFERITGLGREARLAAEKAGLFVSTVGKRRYITADNWRRFCESQSEPQVRRADALCRVLLHLSTLPASPDVRALIAEADLAAGTALSRLVAAGWERLPADLRKICESIL